MADNAVKVGGPYVENKDHVPSLTDQTSQYNTSGLGAHQRIEEVSPVFEVDKVKTAEQIVAALDPKDTSVSSDRVLLPESIEDNDTAKKSLTEAAKARVKQGVVIGEPGPAEREAAEPTKASARAEGQAGGADVTESKSDAKTKSDSDDKGDTKTPAAKKPSSSGSASKS